MLATLAPTLLAGWSRWLQHIDDEHSLYLRMTADAIACARLKSSWRSRTLRVPSSRILLKQPGH
jgi:hypothetical protein